MSYPGPPPQDAPDPRQPWAYGPAPGGSPYGPPPPYGMPPTGPSFGPGHGPAGYGSYGSMPPPVPAPYGYGYGMALSNSSATQAMVWGIVGLVLNIFCFIGFAPAIAAIVLSRKATREIAASQWPQGGRGQAAPVWCWASSRCAGVSCRCSVWF